MLGYRDLKTKKLITVEKVATVKTLVEGTRPDGLMNTKFMKVTDDLKIHRKKFDPGTGEQIDDEVTHYTRQELEEQRDSLAQAIALKEDIDAMLADMPEPVEITAEEAANGQ